jgi:ornithine cyclodeaminase/alanine dehydrogenase-like protein (mu-crystallin family)
VLVDVDGNGDGNGAGCVLPAASLRAFQSAALTALAARALLAPGGVTAALVGTSHAVQLELGIIAQYVPDISHVAVYLATPEAGALGAGVLDQLELSGIGLSTVAAPAAAVFGANLVVTTGDLRHEDLRGLRANQLAAGAVLVNATGRDLPVALTNGVDQVYVDDLTWLDECVDRYVVRAHLAGEGGRWPDRERTGPLEIRADVGQLLAGSRAGRVRAEDVALVELLSVDTPNRWLAARLYRAALDCGLGELVEP